MRALEAYRRLRATGVAVLETRDAATLLGLETSHASHMLERLAEADQVVRLKRGLWVFPDRVTPMHLPEYFTAPLPSYVSLQSALFHHGIITQIPQQVYAVSLARTQTWDTPIAKVAIHHVAPSFFFDYEIIENGAIKMATPEKALLDTLYLAPAKSRLFAVLPELDLEDVFNERRARRLLDGIPSARVRNTLLRRMEALLSSNSD